MTIEAKQPAVEFKGVSYSRVDQKILTHITGSFPKGKITALVGPSGAGKTSVLKLCNNLSSATKGQIYVNGNKIETYDPASLRRSVGLALQQAPMITGTVRTNLALPLTLQNKTLANEEAERLLNIVGLEPDLLSRHVNNLSGGQRQKLSIARTLINEPSTLLLDEITSSLDQVSAEDIEQLIQKVNEEYGTTVIWITHDITQARKMGGYVWIMMDGELIESGSIDLLNAPKTERAKQFLKGRHQ